MLEFDIEIKRINQEKLQQQRNNHVDNDSNKKYEELIKLNQPNVI